MSDNDTSTSGTEQERPGCEECGEPVDPTEPGIWKSANDEQWWHEGCYDKVEKAEGIAAEIRSLMVPEMEFDGLSDEFHDRLDNAQAELEKAVDRERLKRDQGVGHYGEGGE